MTLNSYELAAVWLINLRNLLFKDKKLTKMQEFKNNSIECLYKRREDIIADYHRCVNVSTRVCLKATITELSAEIKQIESEIRLQETIKGMSEEGATTCSLGKGYRSKFSYPSQEYHKHLKIGFLEDVIKFHSGEILKLEQQIIDLSK